MPTLNETIGLVKNVVIENTDQCFSVEIHTDSSGAHYTLYLIKDSIDLIELRRNLSDLGLKRRYVIIFSSEDKIKLRSKNVK